MLWLSQQILSAPLCLPRWGACRRGARRGERGYFLPFDRLFWSTFSGTSSKNTAEIEWPRSSCVHFRTRATKFSPTGGRWSETANSVVLATETMMRLTNGLDLAAERWTVRTTALIGGHVSTTAHMHSALSFCQQQQPADLLACSFCEMTSV